MPVFNNILAGAAGQTGGAAAGPIKSVRFDKDSSGHLNRTFGTATDTKKFTISFWVKRVEFSQATYLLTAGTGTQGYLNFDAGIIRFYAVNGDLKTNAVYRDPAAWYHIVAVADTANSTTNDRLQLYVNGVRLTDANGDFATHTQPSSGATLGDWNSASTHYVNRLAAGNYQSFYMTDFYFIDGQAKEAADFGAYDDNGVWQAAAYSGTFGTNGFHLFDFANESGIGDDSSGNDNDWTVNNLTSSSLGDTPGVTTTVPQDVTGDWLGILGVAASDTNGPFATIPDGGGPTQPDKGKFYWSGLTVGDTITFYGTGSGQNRTVTGDVSEASSPGYVFVPGSSLGNFTVTVTAASGSCKVDHNGAFTCYGITPGPLSSRYFDDSFDVPTNGDSSDDTGAGGEVSGNYATWNPIDNGGSLSLNNGNLQAGNTAAAHNACRATVKYPSTGKWYYEAHIDTLGGACCIGVDNSGRANPNLANSGVFLILVNSGGSVQKYNGSSVTTMSGMGTPAQGGILQVAYDADADKVWFGLNNNWMGSGSSANGNPSGGTEASISSISDPFPVTSLHTSNIEVNFGQRSFNYSAPTNFKPLCTALFPTPTIADGSAYFDAKTYSGTGATQSITGLEFSPDLVWIKHRSGGYSHLLFDQIRGATEYLRPDRVSVEATDANSLTAFTSDGFSVGTTAAVNASSGPLVAWAWDAGDSNTSISAGSLNSSVYNQSQTWSGLDTWPAASYSTTPSHAFNGVASGNTVDIWYSSGASTVTLTNLAAQLPNPVTTLEVYTFDRSGTITITVNGTAHVFPTVGDYVWNTVNVNAQITSLTIAGTDSSYWGLGAIKVNGKMLVDSGVTPPNFPSIASTVRANQTAGFSIVNYVAENPCTVGHGLNAVPEMIIVKNYTETLGYDWYVYHKYQHSTAPEDNYLKLNDTSAITDTLNAWNDTAPTSNVFSARGGATAFEGATHIAYCFAPVEGYSAFGSYTGNGSADGPFVYTGMRPRWILVKGSSTSGLNWCVFDTSRDGYNGNNASLYPNTNGVESYYVNDNEFEIYSNGFKPVASRNHINNSGTTFIYAALAENPFQANGGLAR